MQRAQDVLHFWFGPAGSPDYGKPREMWFKDGRSIDADVRARFLGLHEAAVAGAHDGWRDDPHACLALVLLFDQFPRHMFRDTPRAFATDPLALATARHAFDAGHDRALQPAELAFLRLPFMHAEDLAEQRRGLELCKAAPDYDGKQDSIGHFTAHMEIVARFGRFPHRNDILGRQSTPEEQAFLESSLDAWFAKYRKQAESG